MYLFISRDLIDEHSRPLLVWKKVHYLLSPNPHQSNVLLSLLVVANWSEVLCACASWQSGLVRPAWAGWFLTGEVQAAGLLAGAGCLQVHRLSGRWLSGGWKVGRGNSGRWKCYTYCVHHMIIINELQLIANDAFAIIHYIIIFNHWEIAYIFVSVMKKL